MPHSLVLTPVNVHLGVRKVREAAGMVKVQMCHDDVLDGFGWIAESSELADGGVLRVRVNAEIKAKEPNHPRRVGVVMEAKARIYKHKALVRFHEQAGTPYVPAWEPRGHWGAVKNADCHESL
jgi:hypothetical protein